MTDRRELILDKIKTILKTVQGVQVAERNFLRPDEGLLPAVAILDGDEMIAEFPDGPSSGRWRDPNAPQSMTMRPEIYVRVAMDKSTVGTLLNTLRVRIHKALVTNADLATLVGAGRGKNGRIQLERVQTAMGWGRTMEGEMILYYALTYILDPSEI